MMKFRIMRWRWHWHLRKRKAKSEKQKQSASWTSSIKYLPSDISLDILKRLPSTSLFTVKSVCQDFYRLTSHPELILHHHHLHKNPYGLIIRISPASYINEPYYTNQLYLVDSRRGLAEIIQPRMKKKYSSGPMLSCNGLVCLLYYKKKLAPLRQYRACLFNPLTGEHKFLLDPGLPRVRESSHNGTVVTSDQYFGFAFDAMTDRECKLVRIVKLSYEDGRTYLQAEVFTLGKNGCQISEIDVPFVCPDQSSDVVVGGAIHWLCEDENSTARSYSKSRNIILSFDLFEEKFHQIPKPNCEVCEFYNISVLGGCLAITGGFRETSRTHEVHIWLLKEHGAKECSWTREFVISQGFMRLYPLFLLSSGEIVMSCDSKALFCYHPEGDCFNKSAELDLSIVAICHACSLVSPFGL
ncbi:F-box protein At3g07870-like [Rhododendron vialii]|uniref:F-box protein At3g07870-like n=1 Tax=Rhododendron vialii TaxID=182163 RepID=UPI00265DF390|nr:F-box protein At3g07870-like [Rhododendron vialii]XP_058190993.1 F-box protein At3g07870-like [Rhododendron vialii]